MSSNGRTTKTYWKDLGELRRPNANWRLGKAARYFERLLDLPAGSITFVRPDGSHARTNKTLGGLREEWTRRAAGL
jgi:hypothetical protein